MAMQPCKFWSEQVAICIIKLYYSQFHSFTIYEIKLCKHKISNTSKRKFAQTLQPKPQHHMKTPNDSVHFIR